MNENKESNVENNNTPKETTKRKTNWGFTLFACIATGVIVFLAMNLGEKAGKIVDPDTKGSSSNVTSNNNSNSNSNEVSNSNVISNSNSVSDNKIEVLDIASAEKLIAKYHKNGTSDQYTEGFTAELKQNLSWKNVSNKVEKKCSDSFDLKKQAGESNVYYTKVGGQEFWCNDKAVTVSYDELNKSYKSLFGSKQEMPKTNFSDMIQLYHYSNKTNSFVEGYIYGTGVAGYSITGYAVKNVEVKNNQLLINVVSVKLNSMIDIESNNNEYHFEYSINGVEKNAKYTRNATIKNDAEFANSIAKKHINELSTYQYVFEKENNNYVLVDFKK